MTDLIVGSPLAGTNASLAPRGDGSGKSVKSFADTIAESISQVEEDHRKANEAIQDLATGKRKTLHETMIAVEKADVSFRMLMAVRNKLLTAYQEVMRMQF
jgi:flagellar hook-basal body complex protein FliE